MKHTKFSPLLVATALLFGCQQSDISADSAAAADGVVKKSTAELDTYIATLKGKVVLVNYWATWCPPCRREIPGFVDLQKQYGGRGLQIVGLSLDDPPLSKVSKFARDNKMNYPIFVVGEDALTKWGSFEGIPMTFLLDATGKKVWEHEGFATAATFEKEIKKHLPKS
jgi:thiol-disulfide isomerase/thioredoxin